MLSSGFQNVGIAEPAPPGPWVDAKRCICGDHIEKYEDFRSGYTFADAAAELRYENKAQEITDNPGMNWTMEPGRDEAPGGYRSRRGILTMLRRLKLEAWYERHAACAEGDHDWAEFCENWPDSPNCHRFDEWLADGQPKRRAWQVEEDDRKEEEDDDLDDDEYDDDYLPF